MLELLTLTDFARFVGSRVPLDEDFDVQLLDTDTLPLPVTLIPPFRPRFYAVCLYEHPSGGPQVGPWQLPAPGPTLFFKTPHQVLSWHRQPGHLRMYCLYFTEQFLTRHRALNTLVADFPFLRLAQAVPLPVAPADTNRLRSAYRHIAEEYHSDRADRFDLIAAYLHTLLLHVRRLHARTAALPPAGTAAATPHDTHLIGQFRALLTQTVAAAEPPAGSRSVAYYAAQLRLHPSYLTSVSKRVTGRTAQELIQDHIIQVAKTMLLQTALSIKEISFQLAFNEPAHFGHYFKRRTAQTPAQFRARLLA